MQQLFNIAFSVLAAVLLLTSQAVYSQDDSLYQDLGAKSGIREITGAILDRIYADERIAFLFAETDRQNLHNLLVDQICEATGGPCVYEGLSMVEAHSGLDIKHSEFDIFVEDSILGMTDAGIPHRVQNRLLALLAPMRRDIIKK